MKKINNLFVSFLALSLASTSFALTGCNKNQSINDVTDDTSVSLSNNLVNLCVGDTYLLGATLTGGSNDTVLTYRSVDESIATINEYGFIQALRPGSTEIRAVYGKSIAKCKVVVELKDNVPSIEFKNITDKSIQIDKSTSFDVEPIIRFNNGYYDFEPIFTLSNTDIAEMDGKTFIPKENGVVYLTVEGSFFATTAVSTTLEIVIKDNVIIYMRDENGIEKNDVYLYSVGQIDDEIFDTEFAPSKFGVIINGEELPSPDLNIQFVNEDNVVTYDSVTHKITSTNIVGSAKYIVTYVSEEETVVKTFDVYNNKSVFNYKGGTIETDAVGSLLPVDQIFKDFSSKQIVKATSLDGETDYEVKDGKVIGLPVERDYINNDVVSHKYIVYNDTVGFIVNLKTFSKVVKTAEDLNYFTMNSLTDTFDGYYIVTNDIDGLDGSNYFKVNANIRTMGNAYGYYPSVGLVGVFDGRGHTIKNISLGEGGLFGNIGQGGTVRNLGIKNIEYRVEPGKDDVATLASYVNGGSFENIYLSNDYIRAGYNAGFVADNIMSNCTFKNCYFDLQVSDMSKIMSNNYGVFGSMCGERKNLGVTFKDVYKNVVVNSNIPLIRSTTNTMETVDGVRTAIKFICDVEDHPFTIGEDFVEHILVSDITRFYSNEEMASSGNTFSNFNRDYWHVDDAGMLCWGAK